MSILVVGVNHRSGPLSMLERMSIPADDVPKAVDGLVKLDNIREAVVISTCNRIEIYAVAERFHGAYADIRDFLCDVGGITPDDLLQHLYAEHDDAAIRHLFEVASGLQSAVIGETEILGQVRSAWNVAKAQGGTRSTLDLLFRHALQVGKQARTETDIARGTASVSHAAVEMATEHHGSISGAQVAVLGAGAMGEGIAVALRSAGVGDVTVINRSAERGRNLAARVDGVALGFGHLPEMLATADVVLTGTGSTTPVITRSLIESARPQRPLLIVDIAVPRDVDPEVAEMDNVAVLDLDDLSRWANRGREQRIGEVTAVRELINQAFEQFVIDRDALHAAPLIGALRQRAEDIRVAELERYSKQVEHLGAGQRDFVESLTRGIVAKLLHEPSVRLRNEAGTPQGQRNAAAVADLFDLH